MKEFIKEFPEVFFVAVFVILVFTLMVIEITMGDISSKAKEVCSPYQAVLENDEIVVCKTVEGFTVVDK